MRKSILAGAALALAVAIPGLASAQGEGAAAGAATGGVTGAIVGGPVGAVVGAGVGAAAGAAASQPRVEERVIVEQPAAAPISERTCTTDAAGNRVCTEVRR